MNLNIYIIIGILVIFIIWMLALFGIIMYLVSKKNYEIKNEPDYHFFYFFGIIFLAVGVVLVTSVNIAVGIPFIALGIIYYSLGRFHKDKWQNEK